MRTPRRAWGTRLMARSSTSSSKRAPTKTINWHEKRQSGTTSLRRVTSSLTSVSMMTSTWHQGQWRALQAACRMCQWSRTLALYCDSTASVGLAHTTPIASSLHQCMRLTGCCLLSWTTDNGASCGASCTRSTRGLIAGTLRHEEDCSLAPVVCICTNELHSTE